MRHTGKAAGEAQEPGNNVTQIESLAEALHEARLDVEQRNPEWETLIRASSDAVYVTDADGNIIEANPAWYDFMGFDRDAGPRNVNVCGIVDVTLTTLDGKPIPPNEQPTIRALRGERVNNYRYRLTNANGKQLDLLHNTTVVDTARGKRSLSIVTDITDLQHLQQLKDEFMLVIGHELRTPLQIILSSTQLLDLKIPKELKPTVASNIDCLTTQTKILASMVDEVLNAYRVGNGRLSIDMCQIDFRDVLFSAMDAHITDGDHEWLISVCEPKVPVMADPQRLGQVITNLLTNARKYTPRQKRIWVNLYSDKDDAVLRVEDEGVGIPPDDLEKVFEGFYRSPTVAKLQSSSVGLGLYISRNLTERMGGRLWAENRPGGGTVMILKMPLV